MIRAEVWWTIALLATGTVGGLVYNWPAQGVEKPVIANVEVAKTSAESTAHSRGFSLTDERPEQAVTSIDLDSLRLGDRLLLGGNFIGAYQQYSKLQKQATSKLDDSILIRLGLASEMAGFLEQGEMHYRSAIQSSAKRSIQQLWALIGTARIWETQGRYDEAISLLSELYLIYETEDYPVEIRLPINRRLADCLQKRLLKSAATTGNKLPTELEYYWCRTSIEPIVSDSVQLSELADDDARGPKLQVIQNPVNDISLTLIDASLSSHPLLQMISDLAQSAGLEVSVSPHARSVLSGRSLHVDLSALPVSVLLDQALGPLKLAWNQKESVVQIYHHDELTRQQKNGYEVDRIQRLLRQVQLNSEHGVERVAALMHDGNMSFLQADFENAANKYQAARELLPTGELSAMLYFNSAAFELAQNRLEESLDQFYRALDQTLSPRLQAASYAHIAELELQLGRPGRAIPAASRGLRLAKDPSRVAHNLMTLAKAYLLDSDPFSANQVLFDNSPSLADERSKRLASVISTYARFQAVKPLSGLQNEGERLVLALVALHPDDPQNFIDHLLVSRAYNDVGFGSKAIEHLSVASSNVTSGYWENRIRFELSEMLYRDAEFEQANETLQTITATSNQPLRMKVQLLNARIQLALGLPLDCESICQTLLKLPLDEESKKQTLELLGKAYQQSGRHYSAALCFAGLLPEDVATDRLEPTKPEQ